MRDLSAGYRCERSSAAPDPVKGVIEAKLLSLPSLVWSSSLRMKMVLEDLSNVSVFLESVDYLMPEKFSSVRYSLIEPDIMSHFCVREELNCVLSRFSRNFPASIRSAPLHPETRASCPQRSAFSSRFSPRVVYHAAQSPHMPSPAL